MSVSLTISTRSIVNQVSEFNEYLASKPKGGRWDSTNSLFAIWIGINDVGNSFGWVGILRCHFLDLYDGLTDQHHSIRILWYLDGSTLFTGIATTSFEAYVTESFSRWMIYTVLALVTSYS